MILHHSDSPSTTYSILDLTRANDDKSKYNGEKSNDGRGDQVVSAWRRGFATFGSGSEIAGFVIVGMLNHLPSASSVACRISIVQLTSCRRTDEFNVSKSVNVTWCFHTHATAAPSSAGAITLSQDGSTIAVKVLEQPTGGASAAALLTTVPVTFAAPMLLDSGVSRVQLELPQAAVAAGGMVRLVVAITSSLVGEASIPTTTRPLSDWAQSGPF